VIHRLFASVLAAALLLGWTGCESTPAAAPTPVAKPDATSLGAGGRMDREAFANASLVTSAAAEATVRRLRANDPLLNVAQKSRFLDDPAYVAAAGGTVILQSSAVQRSSASFASYRMGTIEIHALPDGRVRVWADFTNAGKDARVPKVYCRFNEIKEREVPTWTTLPSLAPGKRRLVSFESTDNNVSRVTVLIR
jgi:hypothetical protein